MQIKKIKIYDEDETLRLTFDWARDISQVYIATAPDSDAGLVVPIARNCSSMQHGKLFTLQEYKKQSGFHTPKLQGITTYYIYPTQRENGEEIIHPPTEASFTNKTVINFSIIEKIGTYKNHHITISANYPVPVDIIGYVKQYSPGNSSHINDTSYTIGEEISQPITRVIRTAKDEYIKLFLRDENLYCLEGESHGTV